MNIYSILYNFCIFKDKNMWYHVLFDRFKWRSCLINRIDKTILKRFMLVSFCFPPFYSAFSTHHFTVSNETIITSCVSQVVFGDPSLFLLFYQSLAPNVLISFFLSFTFIAQDLLSQCACNLHTKYLSPILHKPCMASIIFTYSFTFISDYLGNVST